ncbi:MAG: metal-dependent transcriptional regulator [Gaiellales bacterium]
MLTPAGEQIAVEVVRHHRLLELYLTQALGVGWDQVHQEAGRLEHVLSDELEQSIDRALGFPDTDPHGDPIPSADLVLPPDHPERMVEMEPGQVAIVRRVPDGDPSLLRYLGELGLVPTASFTVVEKAPFGGPLTLEVGGNRHAVGAQLAEQIRVEVAR